MNDRCSQTNVIKCLLFGADITDGMSLSRRYRDILLYYIHLRMYVNIKLYLWTLSPNREIDSFGLVVMVNNG